MPYATYSPGYGRRPLAKGKVTAIDSVLANETAYGKGKLSVIDPFKGVFPTVNPPGMNRRPWCEIRLEVFWSAARIKRGQICADAIADQVKAIVGYGTTVWMNVGGTFFQGDSERDEAH